MEAAAAPPPKRIGFSEGIFIIFQTNSSICTTYTITSSSLLDFSSFFVCFFCVVVASVASRFYYNSKRQGSHARTTHIPTGILFFFLVFNDHRSISNNKQTIMRIRCLFFHAHLRRRGDFFLATGLPFRTHSHAHKSHAYTATVIRFSILLILYQSQTVRLLFPAPDLFLHFYPITARLWPV